MVPTVTDNGGSSEPLVRGHASCFTRDALGTRSGRGRLRRDRGEAVDSRMIQVRRHTTAAPVFTVLLVCTGNICRSAMAERLGRAYLRDVLGPAVHGVRVSSAGIRAVVGSGMHPDSALVLRGLGGDPSRFLARQLNAGMVTEADLTLALTRRHQQAILTRAPQALQRTFTLHEAADLMQMLGDDVHVSGTDHAQRSRDLVRQMATARSLRRGTETNDVPDPLGRALEVHQEVGEVIAELLIPVLAGIVRLNEPRTGTRLTPTGPWLRW
jgi:low molecular weight protein-tyrosine phosphatase